MSDVFLKVVNMSISAGWLILAVIALRLVLRKAPRWVHVLLWGIVAVRLICPFSIESALSLIPSRETISPEIMMDRTPEISTGIASLDRVVNPVISTSFAPDPIASANPLQILIPVAANLWLLGVLVMLGYTVISYLLLRGKLRTAVRLRDNIFQCETVQTPFVLGILKPRIYLPYTLNGQELSHVVAHEQAHISRKDHWWKPLGFLLLTVYWFHPLMWIAYILLCRDIELACDEKVIARLGNDQRADYTQALVACSINRRTIAACPLAFGEVGVKERVKSIMNYRKPAFWLIATAIVVCAMVAVCFLTDPNPSREFAMSGNNVADLDPWRIVDTIADMEDLDDGSVLNINPVNFSLHLTGDFAWKDSQTIRFFYTRDHQEYSGQLRIFPEEDSFYVTTAEIRSDEILQYKFYSYLQALQYLPQDTVQAMCPNADGYIITQRAGGSPEDYERVICYTPDGIREIHGWLIHLEVQPLHNTGSGQTGTGGEVIHLFYGDGQSKDAGSMVAWIDDSRMDIYNLAEQTIRLPEFEGVTFHYYAPGSITAEDRTGETTLIQGMPIWNVFFTDLTGDGSPEICATVSFGSGLVDTHVVVYDYANAQEYTLWDRGNFDYYLRTEDGKLLCEQRSFLNGGIYKGDLLATGALLLADTDEGKRLIIESADVKEYIVSIVDRTVTEQFPTDEAIEVFYEDEEYAYSFASIRSHLVMVTYYDGTTQDIKAALETGRVTISDLDRFGIHYYKEQKQAENGLQPVTDSWEKSIRGISGEYLYTPINGETYRYRLAQVNPEHVTPDRLLDSFTVTAPDGKILWQVYTLKEDPDMSRLLMVADSGFTRLCEYAPPADTQSGIDP